MPLRTVRSPKALWYFVCRVSFFCSFAYTLIIVRFVVLRGCSWGPRERCGSQGSCSIVASVFYPANRESFPRRFVEGDQSFIRIVERSSAFSYNLVIWLLVKG